MMVRFVCMFEISLLKCSLMGWLNLKLLFICEVVIFLNFVIRFFLFREEFGYFFFGLSMIILLEMLVGMGLIVVFVVLVCEKIVIIFGLVVMVFFSVNCIVNDCLSDVDGICNVCIVRFFLLSVGMNF